MQVGCDGLGELMTLQLVVGVSVALQVTVDDLIMKITAIILY